MTAAEAPSPRGPGADRPAGADDFRTSSVAVASGDAAGAGQGDAEHER